MHICSHHKMTEGGSGSGGNTTELEILPANVTPVHYNVRITPNLEESFVYKGVVDI
ncbi:hypothetical protein HDU76_005612, partial [Blyttiomyces sp. JEL0837]